MWLSEKTYRRALVELYKGDCRLSILAARMKVSRATARSAAYHGEVVGEIEDKGKVGAEYIYGLTVKGMAAAVAITKE